MEVRFLQGVMGIECVILGVLQVFRNGATEKNSIYLIVDIVRLVPCEIGDQSQMPVSTPDFTHSSKVNKINVLSVLKLGSCSKGKSQYSNQSEAKVTLVS